MKTDFSVTKRNHLGKDVFRYEGKVLRRSHDEILIEALFSLEQAMMIDIPIRRGDRFLETYYAKHWYNVYEIRDKDDDSLKGWYCNVSYPAEISETQVAFSDLALDLVVYPDGRQVVLDEDEFQTLGLAPDIEAQARAALAQLQQLFKDKLAPPG